MQIFYLCFLIPIINKNRFKLLHTSKELEVDSKSIDINNRTINNTKHCNKIYNKNNDAALIPQHHIPINKPIWDRYY